MLNKFKLNIQILAETLLLLAVTMGILVYFSHKALREEAMRDAEQTLDGTIQTIDNILQTVEQSTGNVYYDLRQHLDNPDRMFTYSRELVESNPNIVGCAIVFKPGYYPGRDLFMAYVRRKTPDANDPSGLEMPETFTDRPYTEQAWYTEPMNTGKVGWINPLKGLDTEDNEPLVTFCIPFSDKNNQRIGVVAVDVSINQLSKIILAAKPSPNGYSVLLAHNGSYLVHPDKEKLTDPTVFSQKEKGVDDSEIEAAKAMVAGERGMKEFRRGNRDWCVFYKPFKRANWEGRHKENIDWSVGVVAPETISEFPALAGVRKAKVSLPTVSPYQVFLFQDERVDFFVLTLDPFSSPPIAMTVPPVM
jgi:methyl-accepting chemotaxis protein